MGPLVRLGILGPLEARLDDGEPVELGGRKQQMLLALLAVHAGEILSKDRLIDELWGERPPRTAVHTMQVFVSRLRAALGDAGDRLVMRPPGYVLQLSADEIDDGRCARLYARGRSSLAADDAASAAAFLQEAHALWRGQAAGRLHV